MRDIFYPWIISFLSFALFLAIGLWPKRFERPRYRIGVVIFGILFSVGTFFEMEHERRKAAPDQETAIKETAVQTSARVSAELTEQYADTVAAQAQKIGELEGFIQSQGKDVQDVKKYTAANTAKLNLMRTHRHW